MLLVLHVMPLCGTDSNIYTTMGDGCTLRKKEKKKERIFQLKYVKFKHSGRFTQELPWAVPAILDFQGILNRSFGVSTSLHKALPWLPAFLQPILRGVVGGGGSE